MNAEVSEDAKYPKLLARHMRFTYLLIVEVHERLMHAGIAHTLAQIREEYGIPQGRVEVRKVLSQCLICGRHDGPSLEPAYVKVHSDLHKIWICLFTCSSVRTIHLEWVMDLTAIQFSNCLRRFISRRGKPDSIISDNAPQFKLTSTALSKQWRNVFVDKEVLSYVAVEGIK